MQKEPCNNIKLIVISQYYTMFVCLGVFVIFFTKGDKTKLGDEKDKRHTTSSWGLYAV